MEPAKLTRNQAMSTEPIKALIYVEEFLPFRIFHKKGRTYDVTRREYCWVSPFGVYVIHSPDQSKPQVTEILNPDLIEKVRTHEEATEP
jgi:hypothetical protein